MSTAAKARFTTVRGFFQHDEEPEGPQFRARTTNSLGLLSVGYTTDESSDSDNETLQWERFLRYLDKLNHEGPAKYKLFYVVRHGQGYHNVKEAQVGRMEWERYYARQDGDDTMTWYDAHLTEKGKRQALEIADFLKTSAAEFRMPLPKMHYTSPLARCLETTKLAFSGVETSEGNLKVVVKEDLRERLGVHTCDRRRTRSWIEAQYPDFKIEDGFTENDNLWKSQTRESQEEHVIRVERLLADIFENNTELIVSLTAHSGAIRALYAAVDHREVWVDAGAIVPVLIKDNGPEK